MADPLDKVRAALQGRDFAGAKRLCEALPTDEPLVMQFLAAAEHGLGNRGAARDLLERALDAAPTDPGPAIQLARLELVDGGRERAVELLRQAASAPGADAGQLNATGEGLGNLGLLDEAEACFRRALATTPDLHLARFNLALARLAAGDAGEAIGNLRLVTEARPELAPAWLHLGGALNATGRYREAVEALERSLRLAPGDPVALTWLGAAFQHLGALEEAERRYRAALAADPASADANANLGKLLQAQGDRRRAADHFRKALESAPGHVQARSGLAAWLDNEGRHEEALRMTDAGDDEVQGAELAPIRARILRHLGRADEAVALLRAAADHADGHHGPVAADISVQLGFSLAVALEECGRHDEAWDVATAANGRRRTLLGDGVPEQDLVAMELAVDQLKTVFGARAMAGLARSSDRSERPVFVVGLPRSGKSLVEQILSSHGEVCGSGEQTIIGDASARLARRYGPWPGCAPGVEITALDEAAASCLAQYSAVVGEGHARVIDTMPFNFVHVGLIEMLFPQARVIHCLRHPLDMLLRCYFKNFAGRTLSFAFSLDDLVRYFDSYRSLMRHWHEVSSLRMHLLRYEDLVEDTREEALRLVAFLGLEWDPDCMRYHEPGIATSTAPAPVRRVLDGREVGAWRHYERQLRPLAERLPVAEYERREF